MLSVDRPIYNKNIKIQLLRKESEMITNLKDIDDLVQEHDNYRKKCLNLIASENYASDVVRNYLCTDFNNRYGCYTTLKPEEREYTGNQYINEFELATHELVRDVFGGTYVDLRPISGHMAGMGVVLGILDPHDTVIEVSLKDWGHGLVGPMCEIGQFEETINAAYMPFVNGEVDIIGLIEMARSLKPKMVIFGGSGTLFPEPVKEFAKTAEELDIVIAYDASHVTGLIAGKQFPNPLEEGADIMFGSTHKSFPGPQGGFVVANDEKLIEKIGNALSPSLVTSHHIVRLPAFAASLLEMKRYGEAYSGQIVKNTRALGKALYNYGFDVLGDKERGFSASHLLLVDIGRNFKGAPGKLLEEAGILCSDDFSGESAQIRLGTPEVTRMGMKEEEMYYVAELLKRVIIEKEQPRNIANIVETFTARFKEVHYSFPK